MPPVLRTEAVHVRVPATSANLGPGFDAFGLALSLRDDLVVRVTGSGLAIEIEGEGADDSGGGAVPRDESNLVVSSMRTGFDALGVQPAGLRLGCLNRVPHGRGLGSSAAAIVGGLVAARALVVDGTAILDDDALLTLAAGIEGHPDNVAAALFGGFTTAWTADDNRPGVVRQDVACEVVPVAFVPPTAVSTSHARGLLPETVPHADAARNAGRAALLVTALTSRPDLLMPATEDRIHQGYRAEAFPGSTALVAKLRETGIPATISGAGPTVLALADASTVATATGLCPADFRAHVLEVDATGATAAPVPS
jgi:homoserine kinase